MKQIKYFVMALFAVLAMASCNTDLEGPIYTPTVENISMAQETQSYTTNDTQIDIPVHFLRANKKGEYTYIIRLSQLSREYSLIPTMAL